jgi:hypothetical protein
VERPRIRRQLRVAAHHVEHTLDRSDRRSGPRAEHLFARRQRMGEQGLDDATAAETAVIERSSKFRSRDRPQ